VLELRRNLARAEQRELASCLKGQARVEQDAWVACWIDSWLEQVTVQDRVLCSAGHAVLVEAPSGFRSYLRHSWESEDSVADS